MLFSMMLMTQMAEDPELLVHQDEIVEVLISF